MAARANIESTDAEKAGKMVYAKSESSTWHASRGRVFSSVVSLFLAVGAGAWSQIALGQDGPGSEVSRLALDRWQYILADDDRGKWGDFDEPAWLRYFGLAIGDLTGDGMKDIVSGRYFYRNPGGDMTGRWPRVDLGKNVDAILIVDVDTDEFGDIIAQALPEVYWLEAKDRLANEWTARRIGSAPKTSHVNSQGFTLGQIVRGGRPEIVLAAEDGIYYFEIPDEPERRQWPRTHVTTEAYDEGLDVADIDADGAPDIVAGNGEEYVAWWKNPGNGQGNWPRFIFGTTAPHPADRIKARDINGDGRIDVVVTEERYPGKEPDANLWWFEQPEDPKAKNWARHHVITEYSLNNLDVADFDRDGDFDIVTNEHKGKSLKLQIFENDGQGHFTERLIDQGKESHLGTQAADLDHDGDLDLVSIAWDKPEDLHVWRNDAVAHVTLIQDAVDQSAGGLPCFQITTPTATYYLEKTGGGLSSLIDRDGIDWIGFDPEEGSGAAGEYRGFPNAVHQQAGSYFHPRNRGTDPCTCHVERIDPKHVTVSVVSSNSLWAGRYDFCPTFCTFTMTRMPRDKRYWVLYEGVPGGQYDDTDWWMTSAVRDRRPLTTSHDGDIPAPEWIVFGDARLNRVLFLLHHEDDAYLDRFYQMQNKMTVFGFGRKGIEKYIDAVPQRFSIGFLESTDHAEIRRSMETYADR